MSIYEKVSRSVNELILYLNRRTLTNKLTLTSFLSVVSAILQSAGGYIPGIGYIISPLATIPIFLAGIISIKFGMMAYVITNILLFIIQPSELLIFPFTTGILGLSLGIGFRFLKIKLHIIILASISLTIGILIVLFALNFQILGPLVSKKALTSIAFIYFFSFVYSLVLLEFCNYLLKRIYNYCFFH